MSDTLQNALDYINTMTPNKLSQDFKITLINNELRKIWRQMTSTNLYDFNTVESQSVYTLPSYIEFDMITGVYMSDTTAPATSSTVFTSYEYTGPDDELTSNQYYNHLNNLGIYPAATSAGYIGRVFYGERPTLFSTNSTDLDNEFDIDEDYVDLVKLRTMEKVAQSQKDTSLANDYQDEFQKLDKDMKIQSAIKRAKNPRETWSYAEWRR